MEEKRIVFTNETPNDQGFITRNSTIDFGRYNINPVILAAHDWKSLPIGLMTDIKLEQNGDYSGLPKFHKLTTESRTYADLYEGGWLATASIGGTLLFRKDLGTNNFKRDEENNIIGEYNKEGYLETKRMTLMEISLPTLPSNHTAATKDALMNAMKNTPIKLMAYSEEHIQEMTGELVTLEAQLKEIKMAEETKEVVLETKETVVAEKTTKKAEKSEETIVEKTTEDKDNSNHVILESKPNIVAKLISMAYDAFGTKEVKLQTEKEVVKLDAEKLPEIIKEVIAENVETEKETTKVLSQENKEIKMETPEIKTSLELKKDVEEGKVALATDPGKPQVYSFGERVTFSKLMTDKTDGARILGRMFDGKKDGKDINDYKIVLNSVLADKKYNVIAEKTRFHMSANEQAMYGFRHDLSALNRQNQSVGLSFTEIAARLESGRVQGIDYAAGAKSELRTTLSTSSAFTSLDTVAVEWLPMTIFNLFPAEDWRSDIPLFGAQESGRNLGIIWTNIAANPAIYRGTSPAPATAYTYADTAVGLKLVPYWMQPMRWTPLDYHQLRYNQQDTGWAQAMSLLYSKINDDLLYTLAAGALANSQPIVYTGGPVDSTQAQTFQAGTGINKFYFNPALTSNLTKPGFNDIIGIEQLFSGLNFDLSKEKVVAVIDPITNSYIKQDKATQSMLTRWITDQGADVQKISHTNMHERSRVVAYDPTGGTIVDMNASGLVLPATTQSCNLALVSSQVGIAVGLIDVFAVQSPANYAFDMSMDLRIGTRALRSNYNGVAMYAYGTPAQSGQ